MKKPWAGRFKEKTAGVVESFTESISFDKRLWRHDITGSIAHAMMLAKTKIISKKDAYKIIHGLEEIAVEIESGRFKFNTELEDIHMNIESALIEKIGPAGGRLHTARSRNDQIALDLRLYLRDEASEIISLIKDLQSVLADVSQRHIDVIMPGYTHLQRAQPVLLPHHLLSYAHMFGRDTERMRDSLKRINILPLGSCAMAGTSLPIDRRYVAKLLGFDSVSVNSIDSVSDRDFVLEFLSNAGIVMIHISRMSEELVLWSTEEWAFIEISDAFTTGSSIMPQKKNPDVAELLRGKTAGVLGDMLTVFTLMKGLPLSYNRDMQEDKPPLFHAVDTVKASLFVLARMLPNIRFNASRMLEAVTKSYATATDIAEYLVIKGVPFRDAHEITGRLVAYAINKGKRLDELSSSEMNAFSPIIEKDISGVISVQGSLKSRASEGGTSLQSVKAQIRKLRASLKRQ